jgi:Phage terminase large subunit
MAKKGGNPQNLTAPRSKDEARINGKKGGIKSGEVRREQKTTNEIANAILSSKKIDKRAEKILDEIGYEKTEQNIKAAMLGVQAKIAQSGGLKATEYLIGLSEQSGGSESDTAKYTGLPARVIGKDFVDIYRDVVNRRHRFYDFEGGRGSLKSSFCGVLVIDQMELNPKMCGLALRQVKDTLKDSVYAQLVWAIDELGLTEDYKCTKSPLSVVKKSTGQRIYFRGGDDPMKVKSIKPPKGMYIGVIWFEEKDQFHGMNAIRSIQQSAIRGGDDCLILSSYNTPRTQNHFINKAKREHKENRIIHQSCYLNAPVEWLGKPFFEEAEDLKATNELAYRHEYLGEAVGIGDNVFENVTTRPITDDEISHFDVLYYGQDWGWFPDPNHFAGMHYDAGKRTLYIFEEHRANKCVDAEWAEIIRRHAADRITADTTVGEKSGWGNQIQWYRANGFNMRGAIKGAGTPAYSIKWLASLKEIVIDDTRCPHTADEFLLYEYEKDKDGNIISGYPDRDNHAIDAVRYALESVWRRRGE